MVMTSAKSVSGRSDLLNFIRSLSQEQQESNNSSSATNIMSGQAVSLMRIHTYTSPSLMDDTHGVNNNNNTLLQNEVIVDRNAIQPKVETLKADIRDLEGKMRKLEESIDNLSKLQVRSLESNLFNKANEIQEDLALKKFDLHVGSLHLAALKSQVSS
jgi:hypothetical protein